MLENCIQLIKNLGIKKILINTFYLKDHFPKFLKDKNFDIDIEIIEELQIITDFPWGEPPTLHLLRHRGLGGSLLEPHSYRDHDLVLPMVRTTVPYALVL